MPNCRKCEQDLPISDFYLRASGRPRGECKKCYYKYQRESYTSRKPKKVKGFKALDLEVQKDIISLLENGSSQKFVADKHNINYSTLKFWKRTKTIRLE